MLSVLPNILASIQAMGGVPYYVGGFVRDTLLGLSPKDVDIEVYNMAADKLEFVLAQFGTVNAVGKSFGILKLRVNGQEFDFSLPRRENKAGRGHCGFQVEPDPDMSQKEAAARRDFTINSLAMDMRGNILDPFGGIQHLRTGILEPTSIAYMEDALRVLRGMQFAGRFKMNASFNCRHMSRDMRHEYKDLSLERIWGEWEKWALKSVSPSHGLYFLLATDWIGLYPELSMLCACEQDKEWHPEGSVFQHTAHVCDQMAFLCDADSIQGEDRLVLMFAALCHDMGKVSTTIVGEDGRIRSPGHAEAGVPIAKQFLRSIGCLQSVIDRVLPLVREHMVHTGKDEISNRMVRRLADRLHPATMRELSLVAEADHSGRPPLPEGMPERMNIMYGMSILMNVDKGKPKPIVMGRHLLALPECSFVAGPELGSLLKSAYQAQLDGQFDNLEDGIKWVVIEDIIRRIKKGE